MAYDPSTIPAIDGSLRRGVFIANIYRKPSLILFRGKEYTARVSEPSFQRKIGISGYTQETADIELMIALPLGMAKPEAQSQDSITIYETDQYGIRSGSTVYRISDVRTDLAKDCYQLTLSKRRT
jgi:hypothetical protein